MASSIENSTIKSLRNVFYLSFIVLIAAFVLMLLNVFHLKETARELSLAANQYTLIITIASIPLALKAFSMLLHKKPEPGNAGEAVNRYKKAFYVRLLWLFFVTAGNIALYAISYNKNYLWLTVILLIAFLFCKPAEPELRKLIPVEETDD